MPKKDGPKLHGRFIRKRDPILDHVEIIDYNLQEIAVTPTSITDNAKNTIIHTRLHNPESIELSIKESPIQTQVFENETSKRAIIAPKDFTKDWERLKRRTSRRLIKLDDDEELELELEYLREKESLEQNTAEHDNETTISSTEGDSDEKKSDKTSEDQALNELAKNLPEKDETFNNAMLTITSQSQEASPTLNEEEQESEINNDNPPIPQESKTENSPGQAQEDDSEKDGTPSQDQLDEAFEKGRLDALSSVKEEFEEAAKALNGIFSDLEGLKASLLTNSQENFQNICETLIESILEQQFSIQPETFKKVLERAVSEATKNDSYNIHINPQLYDKLKDNIDRNIAEKIVQDDTLALGDFKIDTETGVVDGTLKTIISDLLGKADIKLTIEQSAADVTAKGTDEDKDEDAS